MEDLQIQSLLRTAATLGLQTAREGNSPIAALATTPSGEILLQAANQQHITQDVTAHAERLLLSSMATKGIDPKQVWVISNAEVCSMCLSALIKAKVPVIVYGAPAESTMDPWLPARVVIEHALHKPNLIGPIEPEFHTQNIAAGRRIALALRLATQG